jgi:fructose-1-phosphate kinase PfkB-like protein
MGRRLLTVAPNPSVDRLVEVHGLRRGEIHRPAAVTSFQAARV